MHKVDIYEITFKGKDSMTVFCEIDGLVTNVNYKIEKIKNETLLVISSDCTYVNADEAQSVLREMLDIGMSFLSDLRRNVNTHRVKIRD